MELRGHVGVIQPLPSRHVHCSAPLSQFFQSTSIAHCPQVGNPWLSPEGKANSTATTFNKKLRVRARQKSRTQRFRRIYIFTLTFFRTKKPLHMNEKWRGSWSNQCSKQTSTMDGHAYEHEYENEKLHKHVKPWMFHKHSLDGVCRPRCSNAWICRCSRI